MDRRKGLLDRLAEAADLPGETISGLPLVELSGDRRVLVENHCGVTEYSQERIGIKVSFGWVLICGCRLELARMSKEQLIITGRIDGITVCRR